MSRSVGVRVFPTQVSERIRSSPLLIHYQIPSAEQQHYNEHSSVPTNGTKESYSDDDKFAEKSKSRKIGEDDFDENIVVKKEEIYQHRIVLKDPREQSFSNSNCMPTETSSLKNVQRREKALKTKRISKDPELAYSNSDLMPSKISNERRSVTIEADDEGFEILRDLDNVLEEELTFEELRQKVQNMNLNFRQYAHVKEEYPDMTEISPAPSLNAAPPPVSQEIPNGQVKSQSRRKPHQRHMDAEKSDKYASNISAPMLKYEVIGELNMLPNGISSLPRYKEERRQMLAEREQKTRLEVEQVEKTYTAEMFVDRTPKFFKDTDDPIPLWKRLLMAKKECEKAKKQKIEEIWNEFYAWKQKNMPTFKRTKNNKPIVL